MAQFYKYIVTIVNQIPQESYICYTNDIAYHLVHILDSHQISNILKLIWLSCLFKFSPSMLMLPCSILRHVWVPKRAKHKVLDKKTATPVNYWPLKHHQEPSQGLTCPTAGVATPTGPKKRNAMFFFHACWRRSIAYPCPRGRIEVPNPEAM